jgi:aminocarboxymuconate-semialdehyde decarboxylase
MLKIDVHTHILPRNIPRWKEKFGYGGFITLEHHKPCCAKMLRDDGKFFREIEDNCWSAEKRIEECDAQSLQVQVLSTVPVMFNYWAKAEDAEETSKFLNDGIAEIVEKFPRRFIGLGTVPLQNTNLAIKELERCKKTGFAGVQIGSNVNQLNLGEAQFFEFFAACESIGMAVFVHPWEMMGEKEMQKYWLPWLVGMPAETSRAICSLIFSGVLEKCKNLRICFAHGGGAFPYTLGRIEHGFQVRQDLFPDNKVNPREYLGKFWLDSLVHDAEMLRYLIKLVGAERIALGTDYPFPLGEAIAGSLIESMNFDEQTKAQLFHKTALEWLNIEERSFINESEEIK